MEIKSAEFVISNSDVRKCLKHNLPEYAFIGRSNVGKSSLINMLCNKPLAKTSSKPGKTQLINHFFINNEWYLVDLPGYGYAKMSKDGRDKLRRIIDEYMLLREELVSVFVLIDCRLEPQKIDLEFMEWLGVSGVPFSIIFTKADKLSGQKLHTNINNYKEKLYETWNELPPIFITSSEKKAGKTEVLDYIESINSSL
ncbi:MAG: YihA family ribosome biogenesis GTP-binding protein [Paludibacteraceae bacterium]|nr:YihA family ribosome biogenesis GTP-binding protein [Paludibacteraceae bacterium]MBO7316826.1 YihA family ribosome biogenesis GTP-binding protein [Paludibacteraceae bacterium]